MKPTIAEIRKEFPILKQKMNGERLCYLDNAATTQKPNAVINRMTEFYRKEYATVHRGVYDLSHEATTAYDQVRNQIKELIKAKSESEIIYTRGTTEAINLVAYGFIQPKLTPKHNIVISAMEHHANLVPWQQLCLKHKAKLRIIPISDNGELRLDTLDSLIDSNTLICAVTHMSNVLGTINPIAKIIASAHRKNIPVLIDAAQSVAHMPIDVQALDCDFLCFSGHKLYGPTGVGVLYGKAKHLKQMQPLIFGGDMIESVSFKETVFADPPRRFEAGTPMITSVIGLGAAISYIQKIGFDWILAYEHALLTLATAKLKTIPGLRIIGETAQKGAIISFVIDNIHPHDIGSILDSKGIAIRVGQHCAQPLMQCYNIPGTARVSFALYNTKREITRLVHGITQAKEIFK